MPSLVMPLEILDQGDIFWAQDTEAVGSEQAGDRLWVVMSRRALNGNNTVVVVPLTTKLQKAEKHPAFCIRIPASEMIPILGTSPSRERVALCHQLRVFDKNKFREKWGKLTLSAVPSVQLGIGYVFNIL